MRVVDPEGEVRAIVVADELPSVEEGGLFLLVGGIKWTRSDLPGANVRWRGRSRSSWVFVLFCSKRVTHRDDLPSAKQLTSST